jgi:hypothetical protein
VQHIAKLSLGLLRVDFDVESDWNEIEDVLLVALKYKIINSFTSAYNCKLINRLDLLESSWWNSK